MTWEDIKRKLTSRKFWVALAGFVSMLVVAMGLTEETASQITALIMAGASVVAYIIGEGLIDKESAGSYITVDTGKAGEAKNDGLEG